MTRRNVFDEQSETFAELTEKLGSERLALDEMGLTDVSEVKTGREAFEEFKLFMFNEFGVTDYRSWLEAYSIKKFKFDNLETSISNKKTLVKADRNIAKKQESAIIAVVMDVMT